MLGVWAGKGGSPRLVAQLAAAPQSSHVPEGDEVRAVASPMAETASGLRSGNGDYPALHIRSVATAYLLRFSSTTDLVHFPESR